MGGAVRSASNVSNAVCCLAVSVMARSETSRAKGPRCTRLTRRASNVS